MLMLFRAICQTIFRQCTCKYSILDEQKPEQNLYRDLHARANSQILQNTISQTILRAKASQLLLAEEIEFETFSKPLISPWVK